MHIFPATGSGTIERKQMKQFQQAFFRYGCVLVMAGGLFGFGLGCEALAERLASVGARGGNAAPLLRTANWSLSLLCAFVLFRSFAG